MKIIALGYSGIGKTYFLGSLFKLSFEPCQKGFSLQHKDFKKLGNIEDIFTVISGKKRGMIPSNQGIKESKMLLTQGIGGIGTVLEDVDLVDIEGQAMVPGQSRTEVAEEIEESIKGCDGLFLILQSPKDEIETDTSKIQLNQMLRFSEEVLSQNQGIPVALILNKIDNLPEAKGIGENVSNEKKKMEKELEKSQKLPAHEVDRIIENREGLIVNKFVKPAVETKWNYRLIRQFFVWMKASKIQIPNRIFPCTTLGFGNTAENIDGSNTLIAEQIGNLKPYGSAASFLWLIYARLQSQKSGREGIRELISKPDKISDDLIDDIRELHTSGKAYFDNDNKLWNLRDITNLYQHLLE